MNNSQIEELKKITERVEYCTKINSDINGIKGIFDNLPQNESSLFRYMRDLFCIDNETTKTFFINTIKTYCNYHQGNKNYMIGLLTNLLNNSYITQCDSFKENLSEFIGKLSKQIENELNSLNPLDIAIKLDSLKGIENE